MTESNAGKLLARDGILYAKDAEGKTIMIFTSEALKKPVPVRTGTLFVFYEGEGAFVWNPDVKINTFLLIQAGFQGIIASTLCRLLSEVRAQLPQVLEAGDAKEND